MTFGGPEEWFLDALLDDDAEELYEYAPCGYVSLLPDGTIIKINRTFSVWTGYEWGDVVGRRRLAELFGPGDRIYYETHVAPMLHMQGQVREIAVDLVLHGGGRLPVLINAMVKKDEADEPMVVRVAVFDATERRAYERELLEAQRRAEESEARAVQLARTLQASLLPPEIVQPPGLEIGAAYRPAGDGSLVGGDFYDVFETASGAVVIVLGDVAGKGAEAAVLTSLIRHTVRSQVLRLRDPSELLGSVAEALLRYHPDSYCTAVLVVVDPVPPASATVVTGGHHLPLRRARDGTIVAIGEPGQVLGMLPSPAIGRARVDLQPGDLFVLFTDGVVEARRDGEFFGDEQLVSVLDRVASGSPSASASASAQAVADAVVTAALEFQHGDASDDIAVVAWRVLAEPSADAGS